ncbi:MAG: hypothetical protein JSS86_04480 [Cyanobacteria bacterium SZAS LIN-2]|nr:hypothetical protein [Cyanobacteria bacterium SZAS LIN-2]
MSKSMSMSRFCLSVALAAISASPFFAFTPAARGADETPEQFMQRYLDTVAKTKNLMDLKAFMKPRADKHDMPEPTSAEDKKMMEEMMAAVLDMQKASTPLKVEVTDKQDRAGKVLLVLKATEVNPLAKLDLKEKGAVATGKLLLEKTDKGWLIVDDFWHYVYPNGLTTDSGHDPDAAPKVASPMEKYSDDIMQTLDKVWVDPAKGTGEVMVEFKNSASGKAELIGINDKKGSKEAEQAVRDSLAKMTLPPLPAEAADQPIVNIQLIWSPKSKDTLKMVQLLHSSMLTK